MRGCDVGLNSKLLIGFFLAVLLMNDAWPADKDTQEVTARPKAALSRFNLLNDVIQERFVNDIRIINDLSRKRRDLVRRLAHRSKESDQAGLPAQDIIINIDRELAHLRREVEILRAELALLTASPPEAARPLSLARQPDEAVQEALIYLGHYDGRIDGQLGERSREAIAAYQQALGMRPTGDLNALERRQLLDQATIHRNAYGIISAGGADAGYDFLYPSRLLPRERRDSAGYRRYSTPSKDVSLQVVSDSAERLESLYYSLLSRDGFSVTYSRLRNDWFVVAGQVGDMLFYDVARSNRRSLVRLRLVYPLEDQDLWDPMTVILFNSFRLTSADADQAASLFQP